MVTYSVLELFIRSGDLLLCSTAVSSTVLAKDPQELGAGLGGIRQWREGEDQVLERGAHPALNTVIEGSRRGQRRRQRQRWLSKCGCQKEKRSASCSSECERPSVFVVAPLMA